MNELEKIVRKYIDLDKVREKYNGDFSGYIEKNYDEKFKRKIQENYRRFKFENCEFNNFSVELYKEYKEEAQKIKKGCEKIANELWDRGFGLYFYSTTRGTGKTFMAKIIINKFLEKRQFFIFKTATEIFREIKNDLNQEQYILKQLSEIELLVIDDIGLINFSDFETKFLIDLIEYRIQKRKTTIFTSNLAIDDLNSNETLKSRLRLLTKEINFPEKSIRDMIIKEQNKELDKLF